MDTMETQPQDSQQQSPTSPVQPMQPLTPAMSRSSTMIDVEDDCNMGQEEEAEEECKTSDECVDVPPEHDPQNDVIILGSDEESAMSPQKPGRKDNVQDSQQEPEQQSNDTGQPAEQPKLGAPPAPPASLTREDEGQADQTLEDHMDSEPEENGNKESGAFKVGNLG